MALFRLTAFCTSCSGTISVTNARRAGLSNAVQTPLRSARPKMAAIGGRSIRATPASANDSAMAMVWTRIISLRLSLRSATRPAQAPSSRTGRNWNAVSTPRATPLGESS